MVNIFKITSKYINLNFGCKQAKHKIKIDNIIFLTKKVIKQLARKNYNKSQVY